MKAAAAISIVLILSACGAEPEVDEPNTLTATAKPSVFDKSPIEKDNPCERITFEDVTLTHCIADPEKHRIVTLLGPEGGPPYRGLGSLAQDRAEHRSEIAFAMNGGMYDEDGQPVGYYVENGKRLKELNNNEGPGNFHMLPNGIFFGTGDKWRVLETEKFKSAVAQRPQFATQSGPMLVIDGKLHPRISDDGESKYIRNAVGIGEDGIAHFVISEMPLSFGKLARFYRDELDVLNALYLDGNVSALWNPTAARIDASPALGPLIVVEKRAKATSEVKPPESQATEARADGTDKPDANARGPDKPRD